MEQSRNDGVVLIAGVVLLLCVVMAALAGGWFLMARQQRAVEVALVAEVRAQEAAQQALEQQLAAEQNVTGPESVDAKAVVPSSQESDETRADDAGALGSLRWLAGSWRLTRDGGVTEEIWTTPREGMMLGMNRSGDSFFEYLRIESDQNDIRFFASPMGKNETPFMLKESSEGRVVFENLKNDFPQRIIYQRTGDELFARVEGAEQDPSKSLEWRFKKVAARSNEADD